MVGSSILTMSQEVLTFRAVVELGNQWTAIAALISAKAVDNHPKNRFYGGVRRVQRALGVSADDATKLLADWARACAPEYSAAGDGSSAIERFERADPERKCSFEDPLIAIASEEADDSEDSKTLRAMLPPSIAVRVRAFVSASAAHPRRASSSSRRSSASEVVDDDGGHVAGGRAATTPPPRVRAASPASGSRSSTRSGARAPHPSIASGMSGAAADDALADKFVPLALSMKDGVLTAATTRGQSIVDNLSAFATSSGFPSIVYFVPQKVIDAAAESAANEAATAAVDATETTSMSPDFSPPPDEETANALLQLRSSTPTGRDASGSE